MFLKPHIPNNTANVLENINYRKETQPFHIKERSCIEWAVLSAIKKKLQGLLSEMIVSLL